MLQAVFGAPAGTRILDPLIKSQMLYQLSYGHIYLAVSQRYFYCRYGGSCQYLAAIFLP